MGQLSRYVLTELLVQFLLTLTIGTLMMTLGGGVAEGLKRGLPPLLMARIMPYMLPEVLRFTIPGCLLFAACSVFGRMAGANEFVALKALGVNPLKVLYAPLGLAIALSLGTFALYDVNATWARPNLQRSVLQSVEEVAYGVLKAERSFTASKFSIAVKAVEGQKLIRPVIDLAGSGDSPRISIRAEEAEIFCDRKLETLVFRCRSGVAEVQGRGAVTFDDEVDYVVPLDDGGGKAGRERPSSIASSRLSAEVARVTKEVDRLKGLPPDEAVNKSGKTAKSALKDQQHRLRRLEAEPHRRQANGWVCLCFAMVGCPVSILRRNADVMSSFFVCFLPILLVYYPLMVLSEQMATSGTLPTWTIWTSNLVLAAAGVFFLRRVARY